MSQQRAEASCDAAAARAVEHKPPSAEQRSGSAEAAIGFHDTTGGGNLFATPPPEHDARSESAKKLWFGHILNEYLDVSMSTMVRGVVAARPAALTTRFFDAEYGIVSEDSALKGALDNAVKVLLESPDFSGKVHRKDLAVALVDLSNNKLEPRYAGLNDTENFYAASVAKVCGLLAAYQLKADCNYFLESFPDILDVESLEKALRNVWSQMGIPQKNLPRVARILKRKDGSPPDSPLRVDLQGELTGHFDSLSFSNPHGTAAIVLSGFPFVGSTMLAHGLFSDVNKSGLWVNMNYGAIDSDRQSNSLEEPNSWVSPENPYSSVPLHCVNAVSMAQFFTLAAQDRMIDRPTSQAILGHLDVNRGGLVSPELAPDTKLNPSLAKSTALIALEDTGLVAAKCGYFPNWPHSEFLHEALYYKVKDGKKEFVVVILTKNWTHGVVRPLFEALVNALVSGGV